jgi:hypothetical protein
MQVPVPSAGGFYRKPNSSLVLKILLKILTRKLESINE